MEQVKPLTELLTKEEIYKLYCDVIQENERLKTCNEDANKALQEMNEAYGKQAESVEVLEQEVRHFENLYNNLVFKYRELKTGR